MFGILLARKRVYFPEGQGKERPHTVVFAVVLLVSLFPGCAFMEISSGENCRVGNPLNIHNLIGA